MDVFSYYLIHNKHHQDFYSNLIIILSVGLFVAVLSLFIAKVDKNTSKKDVTNDFLMMLLIKFGLIYVSFEIVFFLKTQTLIDFNSVSIAKYEIYPLASYINLPPILSLVLYLLIRDFIQWGKHRTFHKIPCLWALHKIHHANTSLSMFADYRLHILEVMFGSMVTLLTLMITGYPLEFAFIAISLEEIISLFNHCNLRLNYGCYFSRIITSPQNHRIHHSREKQHLKNGDAYNFAVIFPIWDIIFGSYYPHIDNYPKQTGVEGEEQLESTGLVKRQLIGFHDFLKAFVRS